MARPRPLPSLWFAGLFLLLGTQVGSTATDLGGSGGYRSANFRYQVTSCGTTRTTTVHSGSQRYSGEFQSDLPGEEMSLGMKAGVMVTDRVADSWSTGGQSSRVRERIHRFFLASRYGFALRYLEGYAGVGISFSDDPEYPVLPVFHYELTVGVIGYVAYYGRAEFYSLLQADTWMLHGVSILGGDLPSVHLAAGISPHSSKSITYYELGFSAPRHWPLRPTVRVSVAPGPEPELTSFSVEAVLVGVIGERKRFSERHPQRPRPGIPQP
jgi:hypothetical protein